MNVDDVCLNNLDLKKQDSIQINLKLNLNPNFEFETIDKFLDFINRERNKLQYCTLLLYEIINVSDSPTYNLILP